MIRQEEEGVHHLRSSNLSKGGNAKKSKQVHDGRQARKYTIYLGLRLKLHGKIVSTMYIWLFLVVSSGSCVTTTTIVTSSDTSKFVESTNATTTSDSTGTLTTINITNTSSLYLYMPNAATVSAQREYDRRTSAKWLSSTAQPPSPFVNRAVVVNPNPRPGRVSHKTTFLPLLNCLQKNNLIEGC